MPAPAGRRPSDVPTRPPALCTHQPCPYPPPCPRHTAPRQRTRASGSSAHNGYGYAWRKIAKRVLLEEPWCPGYPRGAHGARLVPTTSVDHIVPKIAGGTDDRANLRGVCGSCNSRKSGRTPLPTHE